MTTLHRLLGTLLLSTFAIDASAAIFCVGTAAELQNALNTASGNAQDDTIRIRAGLYQSSSGGVAFIYSGIEPQSVTLEGGWQLGGGPGTCGSRIDDPSLTVLDGSSLRIVLWVSGNDGDGDQTVRNLTVRNGFSAGEDSGLRAGGFSGYSGDVVIERVIVHDNVGSIGGGLEVSASGGTLLLSNCLIHGNACSGVYCAGTLTVNDYGGAGLPRATIIGNTIVANACTEAACTLPGLRIGGSAIAAISNNAFFGHAGPDLRLDAVNQLLNNHLPAFSGIVPSSNSGTVNFADPGFESPAGDDYRLRPDSPLIERGASGLPLPALDLAGRPRLNNVHYDIGAYESQAGLFADGFEAAP